MLTYDALKNGVKRKRVHMCERCQICHAILDTRIANHVLLISIPSLFASTKMATEIEDDNELSEEIISSLEAFYHAMNSVDEGLDTILSQNSEDIHEKVRTCYQTDSQSD